MAVLTIDKLTFRGRGPYSLQVSGAECAGIEGASGSGKTLLLRAIADLDPHGGELSLDSLLCSDVPAPSWRKKVAMLPAESCWWHDRVDEHFHDFNQVTIEQLRLLGFNRDVGGWQISRLSTGEKQRLSALRLLENNPAALLLDEPTASLDEVNIGRVEKMFLDYSREHKVPVLWVSHDPAQLERVAGKCLYMEPDGSMTETLCHGG